MAIHSALPSPSSAYGKVKNVVRSLARSLGLPSCFPSAGQRLRRGSVGEAGEAGGDSLCFFPSHATTHLSKRTIIYLLPSLPRRHSLCSSLSLPYFFSASDPKESRSVRACPRSAPGS